MVKEFANRLGTISGSHSRLCDLLVPSSWHTREECNVNTPRRTCTIACVACLRLCPLMALCVLNDEYMISICCPVLLYIALCCPMLYVALYCMLPCIVCCPILYCMLPFIALYCPMFYTVFACRKLLLLWEGVAEEYEEALIGVLHSTPQ